ncbi:MAG: ATP-binding protein [Armatimonadetes bacterium]|nr:ATP-binding protein [Armatimonadota bacterium]MDW8027025.1 ATP-binding protein [Armatimonadota bacterium]
MKLIIKNFRSIHEQTLDIAPITVIFGPNGTGKSSVLYALLTLKNIVLNPNQTVDAFFGYGFLGLGNFRAVVFDHNEQNPIMLGVEVDSIGYTVTLRPNNGEFSLRAENHSVNLSVAFPYPANAYEEYQWKEFKVTWNGLLAQIEPLNQSAETLAQAQRLRTRLNKPVELLMSTDIVPLRRGFTKPNYGAVSISPMIVTEDEVATLLANDKYLTGKVSVHLERISKRDLRVNPQLGTAIFSIDTVDRETGTTCELVNEGFGVNQLAFLLSKSLRSDVRLVGIEEPEIHLHPSAQRKLAQELVRIKTEENKHFIITTHSEVFVTALLAEVARSNLTPSEISCYLATKDGKEAKFERQRVDEHGGIEGGLKSFVESELEDLRVFLGLE